MSDQEITIRNNGRPDSEDEENTNAPPRSYVIDPGEKDILCGKGIITLSHKGNLFFRDKINEALPRYMSTHSRKSKSQIIQLIIHDLKADGARFLKKSFTKVVNKKPVYYVAGKRVAQEKVGHALRDAAARKLGLTSKRQSDFPIATRRKRKKGPNRIQNFDSTMENSDGASGRKGSLVIEHFHCSNVPGFYGVHKKAEVNHHHQNDCDTETKENHFDDKVDDSQLRVTQRRGPSFDKTSSSCSLTPYLEQNPCSQTRNKESNPCSSQARNKESNPWSNGAVEKALDGIPGIWDQYSRFQQASRPTELMQQVGQQQNVCTIPKLGEATDRTIPFKEVLQRDPKSEKQAIVRQESSSIHTGRRPRPTVRENSVDRSKTMAGRGVQEEEQKASLVVCEPLFFAGPTGIQIMRGRGPACINQRNQLSQQHKRQPPQTQQQHPDQFDHDERAGLQQLKYPQLGHLRGAQCYSWRTLTDHAHQHHPSHGIQRNPQDSIPPCGISGNPESAHQQSSQEVENKLVHELSQDHGQDPDFQGTVNLETLSHFDPKFLPPGFSQKDLTYPREVPAETQILDLPAGWPYKLVLVPIGKINPRTGTLVTK